MRVFTIIVRNKHSLYGSKYLLPDKISKNKLDPSGNKILALDQCPWNVSDPDISILMKSFKVVLVASLYLQ